MLLMLDLALLILISAVCTSRAHSMCLGCSGERVAAVQRRLAEMGLYSGKADGEYSFATRKAIKAVQRNSGIDPDGETNYETLSAMGINSSYDICFSAEVELLARCIQQSNCQSYPQMLKTAFEILDETHGIETLGKYISRNFSSFSSSSEPSSQAYSAALQAIRHFSKGSELLLKAEEAQIYSAQP